MGRAEGAELQGTRLKTMQDGEGGRAGWCGKEGEGWRRGRGEDGQVVVVVVVGGGEEEEN